MIARPARDQQQLICVALQIIRVTFRPDSHAGELGGCIDYLLTRILALEVRLARYVRSGNLMLEDDGMMIGEGSAVEIRSRILTSPTISAMVLVLALVDRPKMRLLKFTSHGVLMIRPGNINAALYDPAVFRRRMEVNLDGSFHMSQAVSSAMMTVGNSGSIILVASMSVSVVNYPRAILPQRV